MLQNGKQIIQIKIKYGINSKFNRFEVIIDETLSMEIPIYTCIHLASS